MNVVELSNIHLVRNDVTILAGVSWTIRRGQHWGLLGANGSGKTSLLKVLTGYEWPTEGAVTVLGRRFGECSLPDLRRTIGWVSSSLEHRIPERDTALDVVASGYAASMGLYTDLAPAQWQHARHTLAQLGGGAYADRPYGLLSQGERQRALIARALVPGPAVLILDEPCAGLDPAAREAFLADLAALAARPTAPTVVLVTHHIEEIGPWIGHVLVLRGGRVLAAGPTADVLTAQQLGAAFGATCQVERVGARYALRLLDPNERAAQDGNPPPQPTV